MFLYVYQKNNELQYADLILLWAEVQIDSILTFFVQMKSCLKYLRSYTLLYVF